MYSPNIGHSLSTYKHFKQALQGFKYQYTDEPDCKGRTQTDRESWISAKRSHWQPWTEETGSSVVLPGNDVVVSFDDASAVSISVSCGCGKNSGPLSFSNMVPGMDNRIRKESASLEQTFQLRFLKTMSSF
jgi:hypothetical protein